MVLRLIEVVLPEENTRGIQELLKEQQLLSIWFKELSEGQMLVRILLLAEKVDGVLDILEKNFGMITDFRIIILPVEATMPRPAEEKPPKKEGTEPEKKSNADRISREELYTDITGSTRLSNVYVAMILLSSIVAAFGLLKNNIAVIIGAMVIAPMLGPNMALSLATTLGDIVLARTALKASATGILIALIISVLAGFIFTVNPDIPEIASRTKVELDDVAIALASGSAGALAFTTGVSAILIGVMVAVALLPPLVTFGLMLGSGNEQLASGALLLFFVNIICVNLAGVITFLAQGIRPKTWWEADKAMRMTRIAIGLWIILLLSLIIVILLLQKS
ncbi:TIGR00341 family protein [Candidatus Methanoperedens nitroreducens]|uniref:TIGR00341 family protein n=1 Tax=Candidatus Methanoperedens nitratireducens TaxID=1392998 RepID=A0A062V6C3_9EURY|nr:TIGR00341 family protein [Candidatus Methanoperedens nitroreducens]KCZ72857.1 TIGR00341 family protein [Candidatus Methanoperedens nitroreducens]MDJ1423217.1 TIGR00341 family protein [Candidatus Methanoperedens sp.]